MKAYTLLAVIFVTICASSAFDVSAGMGKHKGIVSNTQTTKLLELRLLTIHWEFDGRLSQQMLCRDCQRSLLSW